MPDLFLCKISRKFRQNFACRDHSSTVQARASGKSDRVPGTMARLFDSDSESSASQTTKTTTSGGGSLFSSSDDDDLFGSDSDDGSSAAPAPKASKGKAAAKPAGGGLFGEDSDDSSDDAPAPAPAPKAAPKAAAKAPAPAPKAAGGGLFGDSDSYSDDEPPARAPAPKAAPAKKSGGDLFGGDDDDEGGRGVVGVLLFGTGVSGEKKREMDEVCKANRALLEAVPELTRCLRGCGLGQHIAAMRSNGITFETLPQLDDTTLTMVGLTADEMVVLRQVRPPA